MWHSHTYMYIFVHRENVLTLIHTLMDVQLYYRLVKCRLVSYITLTQQVKTCNSIFFVVTFHVLCCVIICALTGMTGFVLCSPLVWLVLGSPIRSCCISVSPLCMFAAAVTWMLGIAEGQYMTLHNHNWSLSLTHTHTHTLLPLLSIRYQCCIRDVWSEFNMYWHWLHKLCIIQHGHLSLLLQLPVLH